MSYEPECPFCLERVLDLWEKHLTDGETCNIDCPSCGKPLRVTASITVDYELDSRETV